MGAVFYWVSGSADTAVVADCTRTSEENLAGESLFKPFFSSLLHNNLRPLSAQIFF